MDKESFLRQMAAEWAVWDAQVSQLARHPPAGLQDLIAHVTWYEREMITVLEGRALAGSEHWALPVDKRNAAIHAELSAAHARRSLAVVLAEARQVHARLDAALRALPAGGFTDAAHFTNMPPDWEPWIMLAENTFAHYAQHVAELYAWLDAT